MNASDVRTMAAYNRWMNERLYNVCAALSDEDRKLDRGAFFGSIHGTLNHLLLGDKIWLSRFQGTRFVAHGLDQELYSVFDELQAERVTTDKQIDDWAARITDSDLTGTLAFMSLSLSKEISLSKTLCIMHFFNHQTHHRGQLTALLSQCGVDYGVTDLIWFPRD